MKRLFLLLFVACLLIPSYADSYHKALVRYLESGDANITQPVKDQLSQFLSQAYPNHFAEAHILLDRYANNQMMEDIADVMDSVFRKHVTQEELQQLTNLNTNPRFREIQTKMLTAFQNMEQSPEYQQLTASINSAMSEILENRQPKPFAMKEDVSDEYREAFNRYYKASQMDEIIRQTFAGLTTTFSTRLQSEGVENAEQVTARLMDYLASSVPVILTQMTHRVLKTADLQMLLEACDSPAYHHVTEAAKEMASDPLTLGAQFLTKMGEWMKDYSPEYYRSFQPFVEAMTEEAYAHSGEIYQAVDTPPEYPQGVKELFHYIATNLQVSPEVAERGFRGKTITRFVVNKNGDLSDFEVLRSCGDTTLDAEALRVLATLPKWKPAVLKNETVRTYFTLPVTYNIKPAPQDTVPAPAQNPAPAQEPAPEEEKDDGRTYIVVERMPEFPGGTTALFAFLQQNVKYPQIAYENNIQGKVMVQFVVDKDGSITNVQVAKSGGDRSLDKEAVRVVKAMPKWRPGMQKGKPVRVQYTMPVNFRLQEKKQDNKKK